MATFLTKKRIITFSSLFFVTLVAIVFILWDIAIDKHQLWVKKQISTTGDLAAKEILNIFRNDINKLENLKHRIEFTNGMYFQSWENDADLLIKQNPSFKFLEWIDSSMIIQKINPVVGNEKAIGLDIRTTGYREAEWLAHSKENTTNFTDWVKLTQGSYAFLVDVPLYYNNEFQGTITAGMDFSTSFHKFTDNLEYYNIDITDNKGNVFYQSNEILKIKNAPSQEFEFIIDSLDDQKWKVIVSPSKRLLYGERSSFINYGLIGGIFLSFIISMLTYFYLIAKKETKNAHLYNKKLIDFNKTLETERKRAEKASRAKTDFLSNMSHEIRTPLHAILGFSQLLEKNQDPNQSKLYIELLNRASINLLGIVDDILEIDKIESGKIRLEETSFIPYKAVKNIVETFAYQFSEKNLSLQFIEQNISQTYVKGDVTKLNQILNNLLKNALKFTEKGGVKVFYDEKLLGEHIKTYITIEDTGIGISKEKIKHIFKRFTQLDDGLNKKHQGSGLGLAISKEFASLLGGSINVESSENKGSKFTISSIFKVENVDQLISDNYPSEIDFTNLRALIVDDNKVNVMVLKKLLLDIGIESDIAENGFEAIEKSESIHYDMIFMDIHMPKMNGFEATTQIRKHLKNIKIFGLSANVTTEAVNKALRSGMDDYITKPFTKKRLYKILNFYFKTES